ncbi:zinc-binding dehydrogenase [Nonomuraea sp. NPDC048901]
MNRVIAAHKLRPLIDRVFPFEQALNAASYLASCAHFGKVVISH